MIRIKCWSDGSLKALKIDYEKRTFDLITINSKGKIHAISIKKYDYKESVITIKGNSSANFKTSYQVNNTEIITKWLTHSKFYNQFGEDLSILKSRKWKDEKIFTTGRKCETLGLETTWSTVNKDRKGRIISKSDSSSSQDKGYKKIETETTFFEGKGTETGSSNATSLTNGMGDTSTVTNYFDNDGKATGSVSFTNYTDKNNINVTDTSHINATGDTSSSHVEENDSTGETKIDTLSKSNDGSFASSHTELNANESMTIAKAIDPLTLNFSGTQTSEKNYTDDQGAYHTDRNSQGESSDGSSFSSSSESVTTPDGTTTTNGRDQNIESDGSQSTDRWSSIENPDGSSTATNSRTDADGTNTITSVTTDAEGNTTESKTVTDSEGNSVTTTIEKDKDGNVTGGYTTGDSGTGDNSGGTDNSGGGDSGNDDSGGGDPDGEDSGGNPGGGDPEEGRPSDDGTDEGPPKRTGRVENWLTDNPNKISNDESDPEADVSQRRRHRLVSFLIGDILGSESDSNGWGDAANEGPTERPISDVSISSVPTAIDDWGDITNPKALVATIITLIETANNKNKEKNIKRHIELNPLIKKIWN
jgi:hypothetical protein